MNNPEITVWEMFFMLLTVIPVSKMLSAIFMKLVARVGTVDEDKWAMIGLGAIGATFGLMKRRGMNGMFGGGPGPGNLTPRTNTNTALPGHGTGNISNNSSLGSMGNAGSTHISPAGGSLRDSTGGGSYNENTGSVSNSPSDMGLIPQVGQRKLNDILDISGQTGNKTAGRMAKVGAALSFAVPEVAPVVAGMYAATGKVAAGFTSTAYNLSREIKTRKKDGQNFWQAMQGITGTENRIAATTRVATALALSPIGKRVAGMGTRVSGGAVDWAARKINNIAK